MLLTLIWMLCVYLVLKGAELRLIAQSSPNDDRPARVRTATIWAVLSWLAAALFFYMSIEQMNELGDMGSMPESAYFP